MAYRTTYWPRTFTRTFNQAFGIALLGLALCVAASNTARADDVEVGFIWGPVESDLTPGLNEGSTYTPAFNRESHAARLREELLPPVTRYAPDDKDWRIVRGTDKGPTIFGARLTFALGDNGNTQLRLGAVKRGANRTYGPQLIFNFRDE